MRFTITILIRSLHNWESYRHRIRKKTYCLLSIQSMVLTSNLKCQIMYVQFIMFMIQCVNMIFNRVKVIICNFSMNTRKPQVKGGSCCSTGLYRAKIFSCSCQRAAWIVLGIQVLLIFVQYLGVSL